jgi:hypothetical protein
VLLPSCREWKRVFDALCCTAGIPATGTDLAPYRYGLISRPFTLFTAYLDTTHDLGAKNDCSIFLTMIF